MKAITDMSRATPESFTTTAHLLSPIYRHLCRRVLLLDPKMSNTTTNVYRIDENVKRISSVNEILVTFVET